MITMKRVEPVQEEQEALAKLAKEIWFEFWPDRIGLDQTEYMVEQFQSLPAIQRDMKDNGYEYFFILDEDGKTVGYSGIVREYFSDKPDDPQANAHGAEVSKRMLDRLFISKIYLLQSERGKHYSSQVLAWLTDYAKEHGLKGMYLTVNKENEMGIRAYEGNGFEGVEALVADIGNGFVMDDYIMARVFD